MRILGDRKFVEVPGSRTHELPPLLVRMSTHVRRLEKVMKMAEDLVEQGDILPVLLADDDHDRRKMDLALNLVDQYLGLVQHWQWGDSILEWIRQCETTFTSRLELRNLLRADLWPHAGRSSFVLLLADKHVDTRGVGLEKAVGMRLTFRQPPAIRYLSDQFLFYLNSSVANSVFQTWAGMNESAVSSLPPERFNFDVVNMSLE